MNSLPQSLVFFLLFLAAAHPVSAQHIIRGKVTDNKKNPVSYASVAITGTYEGTATDDSGRFELKTALSGTVRIMVSSMGLEPAYADVNLDQPVSPLAFSLKDAFDNVSPAVITAGTFTAGEKGKAEIFKPRDIGTTAGTPGDMQATVESLPGTQRVGYTEGLFVRGGSGHESKYIMDGLIFPDPYYSNVPSLKQHGKIDPFLFSGTIFSTGGYSAEYGQALSSVLILNSKGLADSTKSGGGIHSFGGNFFHTRRWDKVSLNTNVSYNNLSVYHRLSNSRVNWIQSPQIRDLRLVFRYKPNNNSIAKLYADFSDTKTAIRLGNRESMSPVDFRINNRNFLINGSYTRFLNNDRSSIYTGASISGNYDKIAYASMPLAQSQDLAQVKALFRNSFTRNSSMLAGMEYLGTYLYGKSDTLVSKINDHMLAFFAEAELNVSGKLAIRTGLRSEFSSFAGNNLAPRVSMAYKYSRSSQISLSYGVFSQLPDTKDMLFNPGGLSFEKASHYLLNYQYQQNDRTFRAELFIKNYGSLVSEYFPQSIVGNHAGYARGFELFYRDRTTVSNLDWWISYSYCISKRKSIIRDRLITPDYVSDHSLSVVCKYWFARPGILASTSISYSSPRNFQYEDDYGHAKRLPIPARQGIDLSLSRPSVIFHKPALIFLSWQNLTGYDKLLGYIRVPTLDKPFSVYRTEKRSLFIGIFISMYNE